MTLPTSYTIRRVLPTDAELIQAQRDAMFTDMGMEPSELGRAYRDPDRFGRGTTHLRKNGL